MLLRLMGKRAIKETGDLQMQSRMELGNHPGGIDLRKVIKGFINFSPKVLSSIPQAKTSAANSST